MLKIRKNLRRVVAIVACLAVTTMFASCDIINGDGDDDNGISDPVSTKALQGRWTTLGTQWIFGDNGKFAKLEIRSAGSGVSEAAYSHMIMGDYRISGHTIRLTKCYISTAMAFSSNTWSEINSRSAINNLLTTSMSEPGVFGDFTAGFEFFDASTLRIRLENELNKYDINLTRAGGPTTEPIPDHRIPPANWPSALLSPDMPEYTGDRIREVYQYGDDDDAPEYRYVKTVIDRTTPETFLAYTAKLRAAGWSSTRSSIETLNDINSASKLTGFSVQYRKGCYRLFLTAYPIDHFMFEVASKREIEGIWPSDLLGNEFKPPVGAVIVGEVKKDEIMKDDGGIFFCPEIDFWPNTFNNYLNALKANGFKSSWYDAEKDILINGKMYTVGIDIDATDGTFARVWYFINLKL